MGPFLIFNAALGGFFAFAAVYHLVLWCSSRRETLLALFGVDCAVRAAFSGAVIGFATATTSVEAQSAFHARIALGFLVMVTWVWSLSLIAEVRARWFVWSVTAIFLSVFAIHVFVRPLNASVISVQKLLLPWGETISSPQLGSPGWWFGPVYAVVISIELFGLYCGMRLWRRDRLAGVLILLAIGTLLVLHVAHILWAHGILNAPLLGVVGHAFWACLVGLAIARRNDQLRQQLAASEQRFRGIFEQTFQFIGLMKADGTLIEANRTALEFAGCCEQDVIGKPFWQTPWWSHAPELQHRLRQAIRDAAAGKMVRFEATHPRPDGTIAHIDFSLKPLRDQHGQITLLIPEGRDISEHKRAQDEHQKLQAQILHSQKLESLGVLAGGIAHDFNNLLTSVLGYANLAQRELPYESLARPMLGEIEKAARRAAEMTNQMLAYSGKGQFVIEPLELDTVVKEMMRLLKPVVSPKANIVLDLQPATIEGDPTQVRQVIMNLITNASDALEGHGGDIHLRTGVRNATAADLRSPYFPSDLADGSYAFVEVQDSGAGMNEETLTKIFDPFFTTKFTGRGLGLAAVLGIVRGHRGTIKVASTPNQGTLFQVYFPAAVAVLSRSIESAHQATLPPGQGTLLVVEDEPSLRNFVQMVLESGGYQVRTAGDGQQAIDSFVEHRREIVAVLLDLTMPRMDGLEVLRHLRPLAPNVPVLLMSGYNEHELSKRCVEIGANGFIQKPFAPNDLIARVCALLSSSAGGDIQRAA